MLFKMNNEMAGLCDDDIERLFWRNAAALFGFAKEDVR